MTALCNVILVHVSSAAGQRFSKHKADVNESSDSIFGKTRVANRPTALPLLSCILVVHSFTFCGIVPGTMVIEKVIPR